MRKTWIVALGIVCTVSLAACSKSAPAPSPAPSPAPAAGGATNNAAGSQTAAGVDAQALYKQNCMACHGADLTGGAGPNLTKVGGKLTADQITHQITNGGGGMPPFQGKLKSEEITALAQWLAAKK
jgi:cytochrome c551